MRITYAVNKVGELFLDKDFKTLTLEFPLELKQIDDPTEEMIKVPGLLEMTRDDYKHDNYVWFFLRDWNPAVQMARLEYQRGLEKNYQIFDLISSQNILNQINNDLKEMWKPSNTSLTKQIIEKNWKEMKDSDGKWNILEVPNKTIFYKWLPNEYSNKYSKENKQGFFGGRNIALKYHNQNKLTNPKSNIGIFQTNRTLKLLNLSNRKNIIQIIRTYLIILMKNFLLNPLIIQTDKDFYDLNKLIYYLYIVSITLGYPWTFIEQKNWIKFLSPKKWNEIQNIPDQFNKYRYQGVSGTIYGHLPLDIHRISFSTYVDNILLEQICKITKTDGYWNENLPSLLEYGRFGHKPGSNSLPFLDEEIALCSQKSVKFINSFT